jgi:hypothetical protein
MIIKKKASELRSGDIVRIEYSDYDNFVTIIFDHFNIKDNDSCLVGKYRNNPSEVFEGYSHWDPDELYDVIVNE